MPPETPASPIEQLVAQYKHGYKTSEFWLALAIGLGQVLVASFDENKALGSQLTNLTWVGITYIASRAGLKMIRASSAAKALAAPAAAPPPPGNGGADYLQRLSLLTQLREQGSITPDEFASEKSRLWLART